ncbi:MAG: NYN domain-containing protein [Dehalococcoidia bacterium]|nr:NYN domain-containing protein [Dehalococcoidia bacterium]
MPSEPSTKRAHVFVDGQNLFHAAKEAFGYSYPNYDVLALAQAVCQQQGWQLEKTHFYTGVPTAQDDPRWHHFWTGKLSVMGRQGVSVFSRPVRTDPVREEKGIDIRIALDVIRLASQKAFDVAVVFSQDQDLSEVADEIRRTAREQRRWLKIASAFPASARTNRRRGINGTDWIRIDQSLYDRCLDRRSYRRKRR